MNIGMTALASGVWIVAWVLLWTGDHVQGCILPKSEPCRGLDKTCDNNVTCCSGHYCNERSGKCKPDSDLVSSNCVSLGQVCTSPEECCDKDRYCSNDGWDPNVDYDYFNKDLSRRCEQCVSVGGTCTAQAQCCEEEQYCSKGHSGEKRTCELCLSLGDECTSNAQCNSCGEHLYCSSAKYWVEVPTGKCEQCITWGNNCTDDVQCCHENRFCDIDVDIPVCAYYYCGKQDAHCVDHDDCCDGYSCNSYSGSHRCEAHDVCTRSGACGEDAKQKGCCHGQYCSQDKCVDCHPVKEACETNDQCCRGSYCSNSGVCVKYGHIPECKKGDTLCGHVGYGGTCCPPDKVCYAKRVQRGMNDYRCVIPYQWKEGEECAYNHFCRKGLYCDGRRCRQIPKSRTCKPDEALCGGQGRGCCAKKGKGCSGNSAALDGDGDGMGGVRGLPTYSCENK